MKKSVDGRYYREACSDGSLVLSDIQGAHDDFINRWENVFRNYPDTLTEAKNWTFIEKHLENLQRYLEFVRTKRQKVLKNCSSPDDAAFAD